MQIASYLVNRHECILILTTACGPDEDPELCRAVVTYDMEDAAEIIETNDCSGALREEIYACLLSSGLLRFSTQRSVVLPDATSRKIWMGISFARIGRMRQITIERDKMPGIWLSEDLEDGGQFIVVDHATFSCVGIYFRGDDLLELIGKIPNILPSAATALVTRTVLLHENRQPLELHAYTARVLAYGMAVCEAFNASNVEGPEEPNDNDFC